jgi:hypothetical protein
MVKGARVRCLKGALGDEICAGVFARRIGCTKLCCVILVTTARGVQGACPARRPGTAKHLTGAALVKFLLGAKLLLR